MDYETIRWAAAIIAGCIIGGGFIYVTSRDKYGRVKKEEGNEWHEL